VSIEVEVEIAAISQCVSALQSLEADPAALARALGYLRDRFDAEQRLIRKPDERTKP